MEGRSMGQEGWRGVALGQEGWRGVAWDRRDGGA